MIKRSIPKAGPAKTRSPKTKKRAQKHLNPEASMARSHWADLRTPHKQGVQSQNLPLTQSPIGEM
jgi:hypothetical protein